MAPSKRFPLWLLVACLVGIVVIAVVLAFAGAPQAAVAVVAAMIGAALVVAFVSSHRASGATRRDPGTMAAFPLQFPAERIAVDRIQPKFMAPTRLVYAPGVLCVAAGTVRFVPSKDKYADRAFDGTVEQAAVKRGIGGNNSYVTIVTRAGTARFVVTAPPADASKLLSGYVRVVAS